MDSCSTNSDCILAYYEMHIMDICTHYGLATPYGNRELGQMAPSITWTNVDSSEKVFCSIYLTAILQQVLMTYIHIYSEIIL